MLATYRDLTESAPRELTAVVTVRLAPPAPFLPEQWHGKPIVGLLVCHSGADPETDLAPLRALGDPIVDLVTEKPYTEQQSMSRRHGAEGESLLLEDRIPGRAFG